MGFMKRVVMFAACVGAGVAMVGCESDGGASGSSDSGSSGSAADTIGAPEGFSVATTVFVDDGGVGSWPVTTIMRSATVDGNLITMVYDDVDWPGSGSPTVNGNCWFVYEKGGVWYASTYDFLRPNQEVKEVQPDAREVGIGSGARVGVFVSTLARDSRRNGDERSNIYWITWP